MFYKYIKPVEKIKVLKIDEEINEIELIDNITNYLKDIDIIFPVLHGLYGEDGTIQGMFEILGKKYVGCHTLASSICMDKVYTKMILDSANITQAKSMYIRKYEDKFIYIDKNFDKQILNIDELDTKIKDYLNYPVFIKPSNSGSSVGVNRATNRKELLKYLDEAFKYDSKVLIEEEIKGREVEVAVLGNNNLEVSRVGEVLSAESFYSFSSKYKNTHSKTVIPADLDESISEDIRDIAKKAYETCDCKGLSRIDFFVENKTNRIILNEINTLPGFTEISMYPKLIQDLGYTYSEILDKLIEFAKNS